MLREQFSIHKLNPTEELIDTINEIELKNTEETTRTLREINQLNRNKKIVAILKEHYDYSCQICNTSIKLREGNSYAEVHHLQPLGEKGPDIIENMIVVCPNCHIKLDYKSIELDFNSILVKKPHIIGLKYLEYQNII